MAVMRVDIIPLKQFLIAAIVSAVFIVVSFIIGGAGNCLSLKLY